MAFSRFTLPLLAALQFLLPLSAAYDPTARNCDGICLTSMQWCSQEAGPDEGQTGCYFPPNTYPYSESDKVNVAMLLANEDYEITWKLADDRYPVLIQWSFGTGNNDSAHWATNTTNQGNYTFTPARILSTFPNAFAPNLSSDAARWLATDLSSVIVISQPEKPSSTQSGSHITELDMSGQFSVQNPEVVSFLSTASSQAAQSVQAKWIKGVGIGVGIGVPILLIVTAWTTWVLASRRLRRSNPENMKVSN